MSFQINIGSRIVLFPVLRSSVAVLENSPEACVTGTEISHPTSHLALDARLSTSGASGGVSQFPNLENGVLAT